jgi:hypothetical protein
MWENVTDGSQEFNETLNGGINWSHVRPGVAKNKIYADLRKQLQPSNYGFDGGWNLTAILKDTDKRSHHALMVLDGVGPDGSKDSSLVMMDESGNPYTYRLKVLTRQACVRTKSGHRIWLRNEAKENIGDPEDVLAEHNDPPQTGDIVEWKGQLQRYTKDGDEIDPATIRRWAMDGRRPESFFNFKVDRDGCITVPFIVALAMLQRKGARMVSPRFRKIDRDDKVKRRITNFWFKEVPKDYKEKKPRGNKTNVVLVNNEKPEA